MPANLKNGKNLFMLLNILETTPSLPENDLKKKLFFLLLFLFRFNLL